MSGPLAQRLVGKEISPTLSAKLVPEFGQNFSPGNLARMISLAEAFPEQPDSCDTVERMADSQ